MPCCVDGAFKYAVLYLHRLLRKIDARRGSGWGIALHPLMWTESYATALFSTSPVTVGYYVWHALFMWGYWAILSCTSCPPVQHSNRNHWHTRDYKAPSTPGILQQWTNTVDLLPRCRVESQQQEDAEST